MVSFRDFFCDLFRHSFIDFSRVFFRVLRDFFPYLYEFLPLVSFWMYSGFIFQVLLPQFIRNSYRYSSWILSGIPLDNFFVSSIVPGFSLSINPSIRIPLHFFFKFWDWFRSARNFLRLLPGFLQCYLLEFLEILFYFDSSRGCTRILSENLFEIFSGIRFNIQRVF